MSSFSGTPVHADGKRVTKVDKGRPLSYGAKAGTGKPNTDAGKRILAQRLVNRFETLNSSEREQLIKLAPFSFQPLLARYVGWAKTYDAAPLSPSTYPLYGLMSDALPILYATASRKDTAALVKALALVSRNSSWRANLEQILQAKGDPAGYIPLFVQSLRRLPFKERVASETLSAVSRSSHPQAVGLMLEALRDPKAAPAWRREAFQHLAGTGGSVGVEAVLRTQPRRKPFKAWYESLDLSRLSQGEIISTKSDSRRRTWMLFYSGILGNGSDVFIVQKLGTKWDRPVFTGTWTDSTFRAQAPQAFRGIAMRQFLEQEWIRILPEDASIRRDSDGDGLTDLVEDRLGTNPRKADTDGDNLLDAVDPCPNAAPQVRGDAEEIIEASMDARFFEENWRTPALLFAPDVKPFEVYGYSSTVIWQKGPQNATRHPLWQIYGGGVNIVSFDSPGETQGKDTFIQYGPDHKTARTLISRYSGGLDGDGVEVTLKKIGAQWFVVNLRTKYVS